MRERGTASVVRLLLGLGMLLCFSLLYAAAPALAVKTHVYTGTSIGPEGSSGAASFTNVQGVAIEQASGDVYVFDRGEEKIYKFDSAGNPVNFSGLTGNAIEGVGGAGSGENEIAVAPVGAPAGTAGDIYLAKTSGVAIYAASGLFLGELSGGEICGVATDSAGHIFTGVFPSTVREYTPTANPPVNADQSGESSGVVSATCNVAADGLGNVYGANFNGAVITKLAGLTDPTGTHIEPGGNSLGVDPSNNDLYADRGGEVAQYDSSASLVTTFGSDRLSGSHGVAVNGTSGNVYVSSGTGKVDVFGPLVNVPLATTELASEVTPESATLHGSVNPEGAQLTDCHFEFVPASQFETDGYASVTPTQEAPCVPAAAAIAPDSTVHAVSAEITGLAQGTTYHFRLVAGNAEGSAFGADTTLVTPGVPLISAQAVEGLSATDATVSAKINPQSAPTTYHVEYGTTTAYGQSTPESAPVGFETDFSDHTVTAHIGGLTPGVTYHFRFVATNVAGTAEGPDSVLTTFSSPPVSGTCANDQFRTGAGARLPDCRAYEQATPVDKNGANVQGTADIAIEASSSGDRVTFYLNGGLATSGGLSGLAPFMASRGPNGWSSDGLLPATEPGFQAEALGWTAELSASLVRASGPENVGLALYLRDSGSSMFDQSSPTFPALGRVGLAGFPEDLEHVIIEDQENSLLSEAITGRDNLYDLDHGDLTLAGRIPASGEDSCDDSGGPACIPAPEGSFAGPYAWWQGDTSAGGVLGKKANEPYETPNTISQDGTKVFFTAAGSAQLYMRENNSATTKLSASQRTTPDPNGEKPAAFMAATPDGSTVFFTSCEKLTDDSTAVSDGAPSCTEEAQGQDLYSYDTASGDLTDLTVDGNVGDEKGAAVQGVLGASDDGSYVYFAANGVLAPGATAGSCRIGSEEGTCNLYVEHGGAITFVATLTRATPLWVPGKFGTGALRQSRAASDGASLIFQSNQNLTGYDNTCGSKSCKELFRYDSATEELECVSCNPTGLPPVGNAVLGTNRFFLHNALSTTFLTRNLSADGNRAFFETEDALLPGDTNGVKDVYEWEAKGTGSCESESQNGGCLALISSGTSPNPSYFADASSNGDHAFFFTSQQLVPSDKDELVDIYDAGVGAGLLAQNTTPPGSCSGLACQGPAPPAPNQPSAGSGSVTEAGNARPPHHKKCTKGKSGNKCHNHKKKKKNAGHNGGSK